MTALFLGPNSYSNLRHAADSQLRMYREAAARSAAPRFSQRSSPAPLPPAFNGLRDSGGKVSVLFWLESRCASTTPGFRDLLRLLEGRLLEGPIFDQILCKIEELPEHG